MNAPQQVTRGDWQLALEQNLRTFNGDAIEASELIAAVIAALKDRYDRDLLRDVEHEFGQLKEALEAMQETPTAEDWRDLMADQRGYEEQEEIEGAQ